MSIILEVSTGGEKVQMIAELDDETMAWVIDAANEASMHPAKLVASILRDIRIDDQAAHEGPRPGDTLQ